MDLEPGDYIVCEEDDSLADDYSQSYPATGVDCTADATNAKWGYAFTITSGDVENHRDNDFGNFRQGIKDYNSPGFRTYDKKIREDVTFLIGNLGTKYYYTEKGAQEVCIYVIDNDLARKFGQTE